MVYWTARHFKEVPLPDWEPAFQVPSPLGGFKPLPYTALNAAVKHFSACVGFDPALFSCHSLCQGGCTYPALQGSSLEELMTRGDWSLEVVFQYLASPLSERILEDIKVAALLSTTISDT